MSDIGHMNFFRVDECGLYTHGLNEPKGVQLEESFDLLGRWILGKDIVDTVPWDPREREAGKANCYCQDFYKDEDTGDFLVVLWKSGLGDTSKLFGIAEDSRTGDSKKVVDYKSTKVKGKNMIWGSPCYYWIVPSLGTIVSIKAARSVCDAQLFEEYIRCCIGYRADHPQWRRDFTTKGYSRIYYEDDDNRYSYRFSMSLHSLVTSSAEFTRLAMQVTHLIRRDTIRVNAPDERAQWLKLFNRAIPVLGTKQKSGSRKIEISVEARPSVKDLKSIIDTAPASKGNAWNNIGFKLSDGSVTWADNYRLHASIPLGRTREFIGAAELYALINDRRKFYLRDLMSLPKQKKAKASSK